MQQSRINWAVWIPLFFIALYILPLDLRPLWSPDELRYGEISREMVASGNWIVPTFNDLRYFEKPIMGYWFNAIAQVIFGDTNFAVRIASALAMFGSALFLVSLVGRMTDRRQGWLTAGVFLSMFMVAAIGTYSVLDGMLAFWLTACYAAFYFATEATSTKQRWLHYGLAGFFCGCAVLTKGFLALALPVIVVVPYMIMQKQFLEILRWGWWVMFVALITCLPWSLAIHAAEPDYWNYFFWEEHIHRFSAEDAQHAAPIWYYVPFLFLGTLPWVFWAPSALVQLKGEFSKPLIRYSILWAVMPFLLFSYASGKLATYILPCMAPIAILLTHGIIKAYNSKAKGLTIGSIINGLFFATVAITLMVMFFMGKLPLDESESYRPWIALFILGFWATCAFYAAKAKAFEHKFAAYMVSPLALFALFSTVVPNTTIDSKMPARFMEQLAPKVTDDMVLIADYPDTMSALNWYLKRSDVYLTKAMGEVDYGLKYDDSKHRYIEWNQLDDFIKEKQLTGPVLLHFRDLPPLPEGFPKPDDHVDRGRYHALIFNQKDAQ
ncbi:lipid IV(A) 4-amino-4-deoxy-L-arabinosyltransferase [Vibrio sp. ER1A]|jgi:4-amino-4-deoxy-L-arabinose transferase|uniref:lipid IV(A) 4-amino-4-deoxy-L-arabinosyltransferase n=1 Tax=Vibrio sp. ER1A TaxID=1517681 RepID=UPI0004DCD1CD|nr:lipid IV(A) 4-amino-4-deoxy-L-arabinosyltransferase [Vibrio sp. ER1A]KFA98954.1 UDP phosphate-alpha-4-amino-4-deoxy-L-arabinose arabinosyl transferase [Vibrio sp. ER1A]